MGDGHDECYSNIVEGQTERGEIDMNVTVIFTKYCNGITNVTQF